MKDLGYQKKYIRELVSTSVGYIQDEDPKLIVFQAPTGSGKTIMLAEAMSRIVKDLTSEKELAFVWISVNYLHEQSKKKLEKHFENERLLDCINIGDIQKNEIDQNQIVFVNWDSLNKEGVSLFMSDNEKDWNLSKVMQNTRDAGRNIVLIIDESHRTAKTSKSQEIVSMIGPKLTIEVSATPKEGVTNDHKITVKLSEVVAEGMIKQEVQINPGLGRVQTNEDIVREALKKRDLLEKLYREAGTDINPLLLIQIPKRRKSDVREPEDKIIEILNKDSITIENGKLALWLAEKDKKKNLDYLENDDSEVDVLVFKEAIAQGWDCPRASILLLQREWNAENYVFNIQTLGRIMRMPEQKHYDNYPMLNVGYVYTASDNFEIVEDLAKDYVSKDQMVRDNTVYKNIDLPSELVRRKREPFRLSGEFKDCLSEAARELKIDDQKINVGKVTFSKSVGLEGKITEIDKKQAVEFQKKPIAILKDREEVCADYTTFVKSLSSPFTGGTRPTDIIKSSIRSFFKKQFGIDNEDEIAAIVLNPANKAEFVDLIEAGKRKFKSLPERADEIVPNEKWQVPEIVSVFDNFDERKEIKKSILKPYFVKKDKNAKEQWSKPEKSFIDELEKTDDDILWWFKNGSSESKYFGIAYKKNGNSHNSYYAFYPDFVIKTKKDILVVEIKDDKDFKNENLYKLNAGREYQKKYKGKEDLYFYIISPFDYFNFFHALKSQKLNNFKSKFEENLVRFTQSRKVASAQQEEKSKEDKELLELYESELTKAIKNLDDKKLENEILKIDLQSAETTIGGLKEALAYKPKQNIEDRVDVKISVPFNICTLGGVVDPDLIREKLRGYFAKYGLKATDWDVAFYGNSKLKNSNVLNGLKKGQTKFSVIITGQIYSHSGKGNQSANILTELKKDRYIDHIVGCSPKELLTVDDVLKKIEEYLVSKN